VRAVQVRKSAALRAEADVWSSRAGRKEERQGRGGNQERDAGQIFKNSDLATVKRRRGVSPARVCGCT
jgi:hypothetical protein